MNSLVSADYENDDSESSSNGDEQVVNRNKVDLQKSSNVNQTKSNGMADNMKNSYDDNSISSCDDDDDDDDEDDDTKSSDKNSSNKRKLFDSRASLPSASALFSMSKNVTGQVFNNPYKVAEKASIASLEKHVKMVDSDTKIQMKNGKKICWNYRKGRCRFGSNCTYAHDSDLHEDDAKNQLATSSGHKIKATNSAGKRPGLNDSIMPSKKVMRNYYNTTK